MALMLVISLATRLIPLHLCLMWSMFNLYLAACFSRWWRCSWWCKQLYN